MWSNKLVVPSSKDQKRKAKVADTLFSIFHSILSVSNKLILHVFSFWVFEFEVYLIKCIIDLNLVLIWFHLYLLFIFDQFSDNNKYKILNPARSAHFYKYYFAGLSSVSYFDIQNPSLFQPKFNNIQFISLAEAQRTDCI